MTSASHAVSPRPCVLCGAHLRRGKKPSETICDPCEQRLAQTVAEQSKPGETIAKNGRRYTWKFDHDLCRKLHAQGAPNAALARAFGVTPNATQLALDEEASARTLERSNAYARNGTCVQCGARCSQNPTQRPITICRKCSLKDIREKAIAKRTDERGYIRCAHCGEHKPRAAYRDVTKYCRQCDTDLRRAYRRAHPVQEAAASREQRRRKRVPTTPVHNRAVALIDREIKRLEQLRDEHSRKAVEIDGEIRQLSQAQRLMEGSNWSATTQADKRVFIAQLLRDQPNASDRWIAEQAGVSHTTVAKVRSDSSLQEVQATS